MWVLKKGGDQRLEAAQTIFLRPLLGPTKLSHERNNKIASSKYSGKEHVERMNRNKLLNLALYCNPSGERNRRLPRKRWEVQFLDEN
jgi:hypothetical protein